MTGRARILGMVGLGVCVLLLGACSSRYTKLSSGGSATDVLFYDMLNRDREPRYYYSLVKNSHREKDFCYECASGDPFLVDKNVDAVQRLGHASYGRLEGVAEVVELFSEVIMEDRSALARASAATSLTQIGLKLPDYPVCGIQDDGTRFLALMREVDAIYTRGRCDPNQRRAAIDRIRQIGDLAFTSIDFRFYRQSLKFFYGRPYLVDESDPALRQAIDTALTKRINGLIHVSLQAAVDDPVAQVRADAIRGLKTLGDADARETVALRLAYESNWLVRMEGVEYFGKIKTREGVVALIPLLDDPNASVRHKARAALSQIAGQDYGFRRANWERWAEAKDPTLSFEEDEDPGDAAGALMRR